MTPSAKLRALSIATALGLAGLAVLVPSQGRAWWRGGVFVGIPPIVFPPFGYPPPVYGPPPVYAAPPLDYGLPPPEYQEGPEAYQSPPAPDQQPQAGYGSPPYGYAPPPSGSEQAPAASAPQAGTPGYRCFAGAYVCPLDRAPPAGTSCSCPSNRGGRVSGQAG